MEAPWSHPTPLTIRPTPVKILKFQSIAQDLLKVSFKKKKVSQAFASTPSLTPDDDVFHHLAGLYARYHPTMHLGLPCKPGSPAFPNGTTNGASWYPLTGGAQDYSYVWAGTMEITIEMSCCKFPPAAELPVHWEEHVQVIRTVLRNTP